MSIGNLDAFARHAAAKLSRRASIVMLGGATVASLVGPSLAEAEKSKNARQKVKNKLRRQVRRQCQAQVAQCQAFIDFQCAGVPEPLVCEALITPCCEQFGSCNAAGFFDCLVEVSQTQ